jgi:hypothetical protein
MRLEALGVAVEHGSQIFDGRSVRAGHDARRSNEMAHIGVIGAKLQRLGVGVRGFRMTPQAGQRMTHQPEAAGIGDAGEAGFFAEATRRDEVASAHREQDGGVAQLHQPRCRGDAGDQRSQRCVAITDRFPGGSEA